MKAIYDIRDQIPKFAANFFEPYDRAGKDYPKMMLKPDGKPHLDKTKKPVVVQDEHEEKLFLAQHYKPEPVPVVTPEVAAIAVDSSPVAEVKRGPGRPPMPKNLTA